MGFILFLICCMVVFQSLISLRFNKIQGKRVNERAIFFRATLPLTYILVYFMMYVSGGC